MLSLSMHDQAADLPYDLFNRKRARINNYRIRRLAKRRDFTVFIQAVPLFNFFRELVHAHIDTGRFQLRAPARHARLYRGGEVNFVLRIGQHHRPDVPSRHHHGTLCRDVPLLGYHCLAHAWVRCDRRYDGCNFGGFQLRLRQLHLSGKNAKAELRRPIQNDPNAMLLAKAHERIFVVDLGEGMHGQIRERAIHRARIQIEHVETIRDQPRHGRFPRGRRSVNGDLQMLAGHGARNLCNHGAVPAAVLGGIARLIGALHRLRGSGPARFHARNTDGNADTHAVVLVLHRETANDAEQMLGN